METRPLSIMRGKLKAIPWAALLVIISLILKVSMPQAQFSGAGVQEFETPIHAPDFTLKELDGKEISLRELRGKVLVINFFTVD